MFSTCRAEGRPQPNEKARPGVSRLLRRYARAYVSADPAPGLGAPKRRGRPRAQHLDSLVEHTGDAVFGGVVERPGVLSRSGSVELLREPAGPQSDFHAAPVARRRTAGSLQRRLFSDVPAQR